MFGANKRLRDLGKDNTDYNNYDSPSAKTRRYREQVYGQKTPTVYVNGKPMDPESSKKFIKAFVIIFIVIFCLPFIEIFAIVFSVFDEGVEDYLDDYTYQENTTIDYEDEEEVEKYEEYDEEWVGDYFEELKYNVTSTGAYTLTLIDVDFNGIPELFYEYVREENNSKIYKSHMYFYVGEDTRSSFVPANIEEKLYLDNYINTLVWGGLYKISPYSNSVRFYRYDRYPNGLAYYTQSDITNEEEFNTRYTLVNINISSKTIYDEDVDYYELVDLYLKNSEELKNTLNNYNKS